MDVVKFKGEIFSGLIRMYYPSHLHNFVHGFISCRLKWENVLFEKIKDDKPIESMRAGPPVEEYKYHTRWVSSLREYFLI